MSEFKELRKRVSREIRKAKKTYYTKHFGGLNRNGDARTWWKKVWKLTGKKRTHINLSEQGADVILNDKDAANMINSFFADLTEDFPEIQSEWLSYGQLDPLPAVPPEVVEKSSYLSNGIKLLVLMIRTSRSLKCLHVPFPYH